MILFVFKLNQEITNLCDIIDIFVNTLKNKIILNTGDRKTEKYYLLFLLSMRQIKNKNDSWSTVFA